MTKENRIVFEEEINSEHPYDFNFCHNPNSIKLRLQEEKYR